MKNIRREWNMGKKFKRIGREDWKTINGLCSFKIK